MDSHTHTQRDIYLPHIKQTDSTISSPFHLQVRCGHICGRFSYPGIMEAAYGKYGYYLLSLLQFMYPFLGECPLSSLSLHVNHCVPSTFSLF